MFRRNEKKQYWKYKANSIKTAERIHYVKFESMEEEINRIEQEVCAKPKVFCQIKNRLDEFDTRQRHKRAVNNISEQLTSVYFLSLQDSFTFEHVCIPNFYLNRRVFYFRRTRLSGQSNYFRVLSTIEQLKNNNNNNLWKMDFTTALNAFCQNGQQRTLLSKR